jgi:hypothetical protein
MSDVSPSLPPPVARRPVDTAGPVKATLPPRSPLAVAAFVVALAGFCPLMGLPAIVLGFVAHIQIRRRPQRFSGRGLALWAIAIGSASSILWLSLIDLFGTRLLTSMNERMEVAISTTLDAAWEEDAAALIPVLDRSAEDQESIARMFVDVRAADLRPVRVSVIGLHALEGGATPRIETSVRVFAVDGGLWSGDAEFRLFPPRARELSIEALASEPRLISWRLQSSDGQTIEFPSRMPVASDGGDSPAGESAAHHQAP